MLCRVGIDGNSYLCIWYWFSVRRNMSPMVHNSKFRKNPLQTTYFKIVEDLFNYGA